jgi:hypothetical protein
VHQYECEKRAFTQVFAARGLCSLRGHDGMQTVCEMQTDHVLLQGTSVIGLENAQASMHADQTLDCTYEIKP